MSHKCRYLGLLVNLLKYMNLCFVKISGGLVDTGFKKKMQTLGGNTSGYTDPSQSPVMEKTNLIMMLSCFETSSDPGVFF